MAISTFDDVIAGMLPPYFFHKVGSTMEAAGVSTVLHYYPGVPGAVTPYTSAINGEALGLGDYQYMYYPADVGGEDTHLVSLNFSADAITGQLLICDRLWHNGNLDETQTTEQAITTPTWPARDLNGSTDGVGVMVGIEVSTATTNGSAITNTTLNYTNSAGTNTRTATIASFPATAVAGTFVPFELQANDLGVRSIQGVTLGTSYGTGVIHLVAYRVLAAINCVSAREAANAGIGELGLPKFYADSLPFFIFRPGGTTASRFLATYSFTQG